MKNQILKFITIVTFIIIAISCKKDDSSSSSTSTEGSLSVEFDHRVGSSDLLVFNQSYTINGVETSFSKMQYYISNIVLTKTDGTTYTVPKEQSYYYVTHKDGSTGSLTINNVPTGDYTNIQFILGVDREKSLSLVGSTQTGVLDNVTYPGSDMSWSWNLGYIFLKMEGKVSDGSTFKRHIGLFGGTTGEDVNNIKTFSIDLKNSSGTSTPAKVSSNISPNIHLYVDITKVFTTGYYPTDILMIMSDGPKSQAVANAYANGLFWLGHVEN